MESLNPYVALYGSKNICAWPNSVFFSLSEVSPRAVSLARNWLPAHNWYAHNWYWYAQLFFTAVQCCNCDYKEKESRGKMSVKVYCKFLSSVNFHNPDLRKCKISSHDSVPPVDWTVLGIGRLSDLKGFQNKRIILRTIDYQYFRILCFPSSYLFHVLKKAPKPGDRTLGFYIRHGSGISSSTADAGPVASVQWRPHIKAPDILSPRSGGFFSDMTKVRIEWRKTSYF